jgi:hypothetical protein
MTTKTIKLKIMKRLFITLTICALFTASAFANDEKISKGVLHSFQTSFVGATDVTWSTMNDLTIANFVLNDQKAAAYYNAQGRLIATGRYVTSEQVPITLVASLQPKVKGYATTGFMEITKEEEGTTYYANLESDKETLVLKSGSTNSWNVYKKVRKN